MTQSHHIMRQAAIVGFFALAGCAPDLGADLARHDDVNRSAQWPDLLTSAEISALDAIDLPSSDDIANDADALNRRAAALRARAAGIAAKSVLTEAEKALLQQAAASGQP